MVRLNGALMFFFLFDEPQTNVNKVRQDKTWSDPRPFTYIRVMVQGKSDGGRDNTNVQLIMCSEVVVHHVHVSVGELLETISCNMGGKYIFVVLMRKLT